MRCGGRAPNSFTTGGRQDWQVVGRRARGAGSEAFCSEAASCTRPEGRKTSRALGAPGERRRRGAADGAGASGGALR